MKILITGATGFIGRQLTAKLSSKGDEITALVRDPAKASRLTSMGIKILQGDVADRESLLPAVQGMDVIYHLAGYYIIGGRKSKTAAYQVNVEGTRNIMELAKEYKVPKIVYASTLAAKGDTAGKIYDESYFPPSSPTTSHYEASKWMAHKLVAEYIQQGLPAVIITPGVVFGPGDQSVIGSSVSLFLKGLLPVLPGRDTGVTYIYVDDLVNALIAAADRGKPGEYITTGPTVTVSEIIQYWAKETGRKTPRIQIESSLVKPFWPVIRLVESIIPLPQFLSSEAMRMMGTTYYGTSEKAERELEWKPGPITAGIQATLQGSRPD